MELMKMKNFLAASSSETGRSNCKRVACRIQNSPDQVIESAVLGFSSRPGLSVTHVSKPRVSAVRIS